MNILVGNRTSFARPFLENNQNLGLVATSPGTKLDIFALQNGIQVKYYETRSEFLKIIENTEFQFLFAAGCPYIIPENILNAEHKVFLNIHPSLLPFFPGPHAITEAIYSGGPFGVTIHTMGVEVDSGHLICQDSLIVKENWQAIQKFSEIFLFEETVARRCLNLDLLFKDKVYYQNLPRINPINTGFVRNAKFRNLSNSLNLDEARRRIEALSVQGHMAYIETEAKRLYICNYVGSNHQGSIQSRLVRYLFNDGPLFLTVSYEEDIE